MRLVDVYEGAGGYSLSASNVLWRLLEERPAHANISHRAMPTREQHEAFIQSHLYEAWYLIEDLSFHRQAVGSVYLTKDDEIGVFVFKEFQRQGFAKQAIAELMYLHPRERYLANINPENDVSTRLFGRLGFKHIQETHELRP